MKEYIVLINLVSGMHTEKIVSGLIKLGYNVGSADPNTLILSNNDAPVAILGLRIRGDEQSPSELYSIIVNYLCVNSINYYSVICVNAGAGMSWGGTNISLKKLKIQISKKVKSNHLKLVPSINNTKSDNDAK